MSRNVFRASKLRSRSSAILVSPSPSSSGHPRERVQMSYRVVRHVRHDEVRRAEVRHAEVHHVEVTVRRTTVRSAALRCAMLRSPC